MPGRFHQGHGHLQPIGVIAQKCKAHENPKSQMPNSKSQIPSSKPNREIRNHSTVSNSDRWNLNFGIWDLEIVAGSFFSESLLIENHEDGGQAALLGDVDDTAPR